MTGSTDTATADRLKGIEGVVDIAPDIQVEVGSLGAEDSF